MKYAGEDHVSGTPSRRELLKLSGVTAVGAAGFFAAAAEATSNAAGAATTSAPRVPTKVVMQYAGRRVSRFTAMSASSELSLVTTEGSNGVATTTRLSPGTMRIKLTREWSNDTTFIDWYNQADAGTDKPVEVTVTVLGNRNSTISELTLADAQPLAWSGPSYNRSTPKSLATESLTLVATSWTFS
jgi:hypothetical protein